MDRICGRFRLPFKNLELFCTKLNFAKERKSPLLNGKPQKSSNLLTMMQRLKFHDWK